jgi:hypothetical protein
MQESSFSRKMIKSNSTFHESSSKAQTQIKDVLAQVLGLEQIKHLSFRRI